MRKIEDIIFNNEKSLLTVSLFSFCMGMVFMLFFCMIEFDYPSKGTSLDNWFKCILVVFIILMGVSLVFYIKHAMALYDAENC